MQQKVPADDLFTVEEFLAVAEYYPDGEKWELIEAVAVLSPSPTNFHQIIVLNIGTGLSEWKAAQGSTWVPLIGIGTRVPVSPRSLPQPDIQVLATAPAERSSETRDGLVLFEILSDSNDKKDEAWRLHVYASIPNCQHYVPVDQKKPLVTRHDRANGWKPVLIKGLAATLDLPALGMCIPMAMIYRWTPVGAGKR